LCKELSSDISEVEADDPVIGRYGVVAEPIEHAVGDPFITPSPQSGIRHLVLEDRLDADPRATGDQSDEDPPKAQPVGNSRPVTAERVTLRSWWDQGFDSCPDGIYHFGFKCVNLDLEPPTTVAT